MFTCAAILTRSPSLEIALIDTTGRRINPGMLWVKAKDAAKHLTMHSTDHTTEIYLSQTLLRLRNTNLAYPNVRYGLKVSMSV